MKPTKRKASHKARKAPPAPPYFGKKWQYRVAALEVAEKNNAAKEEEFLDGMGREGWELVTTYCQNRLTWFYFKRLVCS